MERGTFEPNRWPEMRLRPGSAQRGIVGKRREIVVVEGDATLVSGIGDALGIRFDEERNDLAAITARVASEIDRDAVLVLFTTFDDRGAGGTAYFVPISNDVRGTGMGPIDQRAEFGVQSYVGVVNLKQRASHGAALAANAAHEVAHRHLAYLPPLEPETATRAIDLLGRQLAHWHAALSSEGSLMGGHELREVEPGRFEVVQRYVRFSELDLYGLGLFSASEVHPFFFVDRAVNASGARIPESAELEPGSAISGARIDLDIEDVLRAAGPRDPTDPELRLVLALVTRPGESATSTSAIAEADAIDAFRFELESAWSALTRGRGSLCTSLDGCLVSETPDAGVVIDPKRSGCGCAAIPSLRGERAGHGATERIVSLAPALLLAVMFRVARRTRCRARGRSCGRSIRRG